MFENIVKQKNIDNKELSKQFEKWLFGDRGRQVRGIKYFLNKRSDNTDGLIQSIANQTKLNEIKNFGIFSVGGYGRGELHPYSDIDLLLLSKNNLLKSDKKKIEEFISLLWDLGLEIGHSVRTTDEARNQAREDLFTMTNMLEFRRLTGDDQLHKEYLKIIDTKNLWRNKSFIQAKLQEQIERHESFNNTSYNLEPDIKSSPGGLRDIHIIDWLIKNQPIQLWSFFFGVLVTSIFFLKKLVFNWNFYSAIFLIIGILISYLLTSLPLKAQEQFLKSINGLEEVKIAQAGYAI